MNEQEWLNCINPQHMLRFLDARNTQQAPKNSPIWDFWIRGGISDRKLRLFACACVRQVWHLLTDDAPCSQCGGSGQFPSVYGLPVCHNCSGTGRVNRSRRAVEVAERGADGLADEAEQRTADADADRADCEHGGPFKEPFWAAECAVGMEAAEAAHCVVEAKIVLGAVAAALLREIVGNPFRPVTLPFTLVSPPLVRGEPNELRQSCLWLTPTVLAIAETAYEERLGLTCKRCKGRKYIHKRTSDDTGFGRATVTLDCPDCGAGGNIDNGTLDPERLAVLGDALEDAGCDNWELLEHFRGALCGGVLRNLHTHVRGCWALDLVLGKL